METKNLLKSLKRRLSGMLCLVALLCITGRAYAYNQSNVTIYYDNSETKWSSCYFMQGKNSHASRVSMSRVSGTQYLWKCSTGSYDGAEGFRITKQSSGYTDGIWKACWGSDYESTYVYQSAASSNTIYTTNGYESRKTADCSAGKQEYNWGSTKTNTTYIVTISCGSGGSLTVKDYDNASVNNGASKNYLTVLKITASPNDGYKLKSLTYDGTSISSGDSKTLTKAVTIAAEFEQECVISAYSLGGYLNGADKQAYDSDASFAFVSQGDGTYKLTRSFTTADNYFWVFDNCGNKYGVTTYTENNPATLVKDGNEKVGAKGLTTGANYNITWNPSTNQIGWSLACTNPDPGFDASASWSGNFADNNRTISLSTQVETNFYSWNFCDEDGSNPEYIGYGKSITKAVDLPGTYYFKVLAGCTTASVSSKVVSVTLPVPQIGITGNGVADTQGNSPCYAKNDGNCGSPTNLTWTKDFVVTAYWGYKTISIHQRYKSVSTGDCSGETGWSISNFILASQITSITGGTKAGSEITLDNSFNVGDRARITITMNAYNDYSVSIVKTCTPPESVEASYLVNPNNHVDDAFWNNKFSDGHRTLEIRVAKNASYSYYVPVLIDGSGNEVLEPTVAANHATFGERTEDATFYYFPVLLDLPSTTYKFKVRVGCSYENSTASNLLTYTSPAVQMGIAGPLFYQAWDCMAQGAGFNGSMTPDPSNPRKWTQELMINRADNTEDWINHFAIFQRYKRDNADICEGQSNTEGWDIYDDDSGAQIKYANKIGYAQNQTLLPAENCPFEIKLDETTSEKTGNYRLKDEANITNFSKVKITVEMTGWDTYSIKMEVTCLQPTAGFAVSGDWTTGPFADATTSRTFTLSSVAANNYRWYEDGGAMGWDGKDMSKTYTLPGSHTYKVAAGCDGSHLVESAPKTITMPFPAMRIEGPMVKGGWNSNYPASKSIEATSTDGTYIFAFNVTELAGSCGFRIGQQYKGGVEWSNGNDITAQSTCVSGCTKDGGHFDHNISSPDLVATEKVKVTVVMNAWNSYNVTLERICGKPYIKFWTIPESACVGSEYPVTAEFWSDYGPISTYDWSATVGWTPAQAQTQGNSNTFTAGSSNGTITVTATSHCSSSQSQAATSDEIPVHPIPTVSIAAPADACGTGDITFTSSNVTPDGATVNWYEGETSLGTGETYTFSSVAGGTSKTVKAKAAKDGCESAFTAEVSGSRLALPNLTLSGVGAKTAAATYPWEYMTVTATTDANLSWNDLVVPASIGANDYVYEQGATANVKKLKSKQTANEDTDKFEISATATDGNNCSTTKTYNVYINAAPAEVCE